MGLLPKVLMVEPLWVAGRGFDEVKNMVLAVGRVSGGVPRVGADVSPKSKELPTLVVMVPIPKLLGLARVTPAKETVPPPDLYVSFRLIRFVTVTEFCTRLVVPSGAAVTGSVELKTRVPVLKLMFGASTYPLEL